jgi:predicted DNA-binding antitoxin AbrB/MazE fold protein
MCHEKSYRLLPKVYGLRLTIERCDIIHSMRAIEAEFEDGFLKPTQPLPLRPGERVSLVVMRKVDPQRWNLQKLAVTTPEDDELASAGLGDWVEQLESEDSV